MKPTSAQEWEKNVRKLLSEFAQELLILDSLGRSGKKIYGTNIILAREKVNEKMVDSIRSTLASQRKELVEEIKEWIGKYKCDFDYDFEKLKWRRKEYVALDEFEKFLDKI